MPRAKKNQPVEQPLADVPAPLPVAEVSTEDSTAAKKKPRARKVTAPAQDIDEVPSETREEAPKKPKKATAATSAAPAPAPAPAAAAPAGAAPKKTKKRGPNAEPEAQAAAEAKAEADASAGEESPKKKTKAKKAKQTKPAKPAPPPSPPPAQQHEDDEQADPDAGAEDGGQGDGAEEDGGEPSEGEAPKPKKRARSGTSGKKRRTTVEEVAYLRQKVKDLQAKLGKQKDEEKRKKEEAKQAKSEAKANRKRNNFIVVRERARETRCPFSYNRHDKAGWKLYVWQQRPMKNGNLFWCPVGITEDDAEALASANLTREQAAAALRGEPVEGIISGEKEQAKDARTHAEDQEEEEDGGEGEEEGDEEGAGEEDEEDEEDEEEEEEE